MKVNRIITKISKWLAIYLICLAFAGLAFRATLYWQIPVEAGDAYSFGDILELHIYLILLVSAALVFLCSILLTLLKNYKAAVWIFLVSVITPFCYYLLHPIVPRLW
jgi:hypothetical protein